MKNIFCVGQLVIDNSVDLGRVKRTITAVIDKDHIVLDSVFTRKNNEVFCIPEYMDKTSYFYHHSNVDTEKMNYFFAAYLEAFQAVAEIEEHGTLDGEPVKGAFATRLSDHYSKILEDSAPALEVALKDYRVTLHNMDQWALNRSTLDHHFPYIEEA